MRSGLASSISNASLRQLGGVYAEIMLRSPRMSAKSFREKSAKDFLSKFRVILGWFFGCKIGVGGGIKKIPNDPGAKKFQKNLSQISCEDSETFILRISVLKPERGGVKF